MPLHPALQALSAAEAARLMPADSSYRHAPHDYLLQARYLWVDGDWHVDGALDLDAIHFDAGDDEYIRAIIVRGDMHIKNLYNGETDGSCGLIVLGDLHAENVVVGGQEIYVGGSLHVSGLYWGDYNHGDLQVKGEVHMRVFLETDYGYDRARFRQQRDVNIRYALYDDDEAGYDSGRLLTALLQAPFTLSREEAMAGEERIWSWKYWINHDTLFPALEANQSLLRDEAEVDLGGIPLVDGCYSIDICAELIERAQIPFLFADERISLENLRVFTASPAFQAASQAYEDDCRRFEYEQDGIFYRLHCDNGEDIGGVYIRQGDDFALWLEAEEGCLKQYYCRLPSEDWHLFDAESWPQMDAFLQEEWQKLQWTFCKTVHYRRLFLQTVTWEKFAALFELPLVRQYCSDYADPESVLYIGDFTFQVRPETENDWPRITMTAKGYYDEDNHYQATFYHYEYHADSKEVVLLTQDGNGYAFEPYIVPYHHSDFYREAAALFAQTDNKFGGRTIYTGSNEYLNP
ncbi:hypothetical protein L1281_000080 [Neisseria sp. HSC-16F19]|nr:hypothetical protein [Neisseria sp. HSC-16F19]MCP2039515.1 hypothetical protein [Neisseria sp. HSC-16F19]